MGIQPVVRRWTLLIGILAACNRVSAPGESGALAVKAAKASIPADGVSVSIVRVTGTGGRPVELSTSLGLLTGPGGGAGVRVPLAGDGQATLSSGCSDDFDAACAGSATLRVSLTDGGGEATTSVAFARTSASPTRGGVAKADPARPAPSVDAGPPANTRLTGDSAWSVLRAEPAGDWKATHLAGSEDGGAGTAYALTSDGSVIVWNEAVSGLVPEATTVRAPGGSFSRYLAEPIRLVGLAGPVEALAPGLQHACALLRGGRVQCWGRNSLGELGAEGGRVAGVFPPNLAPAIPDLDAVAVASGRHFSCALSRDGAVWCWGWNYHGQIGSDTTSVRAGPTKVSALRERVRSIHAGDRLACAVMEGGEVICWGDGPTDARGRAPAAVAWLKGTRDLVIGDGQICGWGEDGGLRCTGSAFEDIVLPRKFMRDRPPVMRDWKERRRARTLSGGSDRFCASLEEGSVSCWGTGAGTPEDRPAKVDGLPAVEEVLAKGAFACARTAAGAVWCWGYGLKGRYGKEADTIPVLVNGPEASAR